MAEFLLRKDSSNLNWKNKDLLTPLHAAVDKNHIDVVELLLKFGANINSIDCVGQTTLHRCAQNNNPQVSLVAWVAQLLRYAHVKSLVSSQLKVKLCLFLSLVLFFGC